MIPIFIRLSSFPLSGLRRLGRQPEELLHQCSSGFSSGCELQRLKNDCLYVGSQRGFCNPGGAMALEIHASGTEFSEGIGRINEIRESPSQIHDLPLLSLIAAICTVS